jgi:hypothetical protein
MSPKAALFNFLRNALAWSAVFISFSSRVVAAVPSESLQTYLGPQPGKTYVYTVEGPEGEKVSSVTVAGVEGQGADSRVTCSPASPAEYSKELRDRGAKPIISKLEIKDGTLVSMHGSIKATLLRTPLRPGPELWQNRQTVVMPGGARHTTVLQCGISEIGRGNVLGQERSTVTVQCAGKSSAGSVLTSSTYAEGLGLIEETTQFSDNDLKPAGKFRQVLAEIREGAHACAALVNAVGPTVEHR